MNFATLDVETARPDLTSICQIGIAYFQESTVVGEWSSLVDPQTDFDPINISIHGITKEAVKGAPTFPELIGELQSRLSGLPVITHTATDRTALRKACELAALPVIECRWIDSAVVARRTWEELSKSGYGLASVCKKIGYEFKHHDALEDAKAAGYVFLAASKASGRNIDDWFSFLEERTRRSRTGPWPSNKITLEANPEGPLYGESIVFTGELKSLSREEAAKLAAIAGCFVKNSVTKNTTILCIGDQDLKLLAGHAKSSKHRRAEELIASGQEIRIIGETDFFDMIATARS